MPRRDMAVAGAMLVFALLALYESWRMPIFDGQVLAAPGLFPAVAAGGIALLSLAVLVNRLPQAMGWRPTTPEAPAEDPGNAKQALLCAAVVGVALLLMRPFGFVAAGVVATIGLMLAGLARRPRPGEALLIAVAGLGLPFAVHWLFTQVFLTPLP